MSVGIRHDEARPERSLSVKEITIHKVPFNHLYADLSYRDFFARYYPHRDGRVYAATYSFDADHFDFWWRLEPTSTFYIDRKYASQAQQFLRRFPLFEVYAVDQLHTKAVFFERSGVLLVGSENIYAPTSIFAEVMIETFIPEDQRPNVIELIFGHLRGRILTAKYGVNDIRIHAAGSSASGRPFLPCHREVPYWDTIGPPPVLGREPFDACLPPPNPEPRKFHRWVYHLSEYNVQGQRCALAFDRGYTYCGDLDESALDWLLLNCEIVERRSGTGPIEQSPTTMVKDRFYRYHPIASCNPSSTDYWLGPVKNTDAFTHLFERCPGDG